MYQGHHKRKSKKKELMASVGRIELQKVPKFKGLRRNGYTFGLISLSQSQGQEG